MTLSFQAGSILGVVLFGIGAFVQMYMGYLVRGMDSFSTIQRGDMRKYRDLVAQGKVPFWPIAARYLFCTAGFILALTAILFLK